MARLDITGQKYGLLTAVRYTRTTLSRHSVWEFRCDCGNSIEYLMHEVRRGNKSSCGCLPKGTLKLHGLSRTRAYQMWLHMKQSCYNTRNHRYPRVGAKGIKVCQEWLEPAAFCTWANAEGAEEPGSSLRRFDKAKDFCPENCMVIPRGYYEI